jgi:hypothetical protein
MSNQHDNQERAFIVAMAGVVGGWLFWLAYCAWLWFQIV